MPTDAPIYAEDGEVILGQDSKGYVHLPLMVEDGYGISVSVLGVYPPKQILGDYTRDSHQLLSSHIQSSWIGGGQIYEAQEATDTERYWWATLETRFPRALSLMPLTTAVTGPNASGARPLGDYGTATLASFGAKLRLVESLTASGGADLTATPVNKGAAFAGSGTNRFYIPLGASGVDVWDGATVTNVAGVTAQSVCIFDEKLYAVQTDGTIKYTVDGTTWVSPGLKVDGNYTIRHIVSFYDRADNPCLHVITNSDVFAVDTGGPAIYLTELQYPKHPQQGLAACIWRTDLYVSVGAGLHRYTGSVITSTGVDRDEGLPQDFSGTYADITGAYNGIYALFAGEEAISGELEEELSLDLGAGGDDFYAASTAGSSMVMVWDGFGWHCLWVADTVGDPTSIFVSGGGSAGEYRLWWGYDGDLYYQDLPVIFQNPKQRNVGTYATQGYLETPWLDMNMTGSRKILASIEVDTLNCDSNNTIQVLYATDGGGYSLLDTIDSDGHHKMRLGLNGQFPDGSAYRYDGSGFERIRLKFIFTRDPSDSSVTPIMESGTIVFMKRMGNLKAWEFIANLTFEGEYKGRGRDELRLYLENSVDDEAFMPFCHANRWYSVKVSGVSGTDSSGTRLAGNRRINVVESFDLVLLIFVLASIYLVSLLGGVA